MKTNSSMVPSEPSKSKHPTVFLKKRRALIRIQHIESGDALQEYGTIYTLDPKNESTIAVYGGHQAIVLDREIPDFEEWTIVSLVELWS